MLVDCDSLCSKSAIGVLFVSFGDGVNNNSIFAHLEFREKSRLASGIVDCFVDS
jgi:hypothetical protein